MSAQCKFDLKSQVWFQTKIARHEVQLPTAILKSQNSGSTNIYFTDQEASLLKSGNKKAFTSRFVFETEMMRQRAKIVRFKTEMMRFRTWMTRFRTDDLRIHHIAEANQIAGITSDFKMDIIKSINIDDIDWFPMSIFIDWLRLVVFLPNPFPYFGLFASNSR